MKFNRFIATSALVLGCATASQADVYITGSTAMRSQIYALFTTVGEVFSAAPTVTVYDDGAASGQPQKGNWMVFQGSLVGGGSSTVFCHWSGSDGGISDLANNATELFVTGASINGSDNGTAIPANTASHTVDLALADNDQAFASVYGNNAGTPPAALATESEIAVITFEWVRNPGLWTGANITDVMIRGAIGGGVKRSLFTGTAGQADFVYAQGRTPDSGTRVNALGESGYGIFTPPKQIEISTSGGAMILLNPSGRNNQAKYSGNFGYTSGGTLAGTMGTSTTGATDQINGGTGFSVIAYLGVSDANSAVGKGATALTYNGVTYSAAAVIDGQYNFWGNEYIFQNNTLGADATDAGLVYANTIANIPNHVDGNTAISLTTMNCTRQGPLSDPVHK